MHSVPGNDLTIRNQRYHGGPAWAWIAGWFAVWLSAIAVLEWTTPKEWEKRVLLATAVPIFITFFVMVRYLDLRPVVRLRLGDELRAYPSGRYQPVDLVVIRFSPDTDEDYAEEKLPVPWCQVAVQGRRGRIIRLVASVGDAVRLREWAERKGVRVEDTEGFAMRGGPTD